MKAAYSQRSIEKAVSEGRISAKDIALIKEFVNERKASAGISLSRSNKITFTLVTWRRFLPPFHEMTIVDFYDGIEAMKSGVSCKGTPFKQNTRHDLIRILKQFSLWLIENEYSTLPEKKIRRIKVPSPNPMTKTAAQLLTPEEVRMMLSACRRSYDRALIGLLYEGGLRIGEAGIDELRIEESCWDRGD